NDVTVLMEVYNKMVDDLPLVEVHRLLYSSKGQLKAEANADHNGKTNSPVMQAPKQPEALLLFS
ncbi:MAG TPA: hypothetical protein VN457_04705, partial [Chlamydiales bacterium]|nr:hypothetical protein [Chlamydiales bacterium]